MSGSINRDDLSSGTSGIRSFDRLFIGGRWVEPSTRDRVDVVSPVTEEVIGHYARASSVDAEKAVQSAREAFDHGDWPWLGAVERAGHLRRIAREVEERVPEMSRAFSREIGIPLAQARMYVSGAVSMWEGAASVVEGFNYEEVKPVESGTAVLRHEPVGVVAAITPWNAPVGNASIKLAPALSAGCSVVVKPAPEGPTSALILAEALESAGLPDGVVSILPGDRELGEFLVTHPLVDKVTFTGSTQAGQRIMSLCGERIARVTLELGGKSAGIVADDVDMAPYLSGLVNAGIGHSGQICAALTRILVPSHRQADLVEEIAAIMANYRVGDPEDPEVDLGPLAMERQRTRVEEYVRIGQTEGARIVTGGARPRHLEKGWFVEPTLFADVKPHMRIAQEEIFGPVICVLPFDSIDEAVTIANGTPYGLSGAVYAADLELAEWVARRVRAGQMWINSWGMCITEPFGGMKQSGLGREGGLEGLSGFQESKYLQRA